MDRSLDDLSERFRPLAEALLKAFDEAGIRYIVVDTLRTAQEQADALARGVSWTLKSKHLTGDAIDVAPLLQGTSKVDWDSSDPAWEQMGKIGEELGLRWGKNFPKPDLGHFEYVEKV